MNPTEKELAAMFPEVSSKHHLRVTDSHGKTVCVLLLARRDYTTGKETDPTNLTVAVETLPAKGQARKGWLTSADLQPGDVERNGGRRPSVYATEEKLIFRQWEVALQKALPTLAKLYDHGITDIQERHLQRAIAGQL